MHDSLIRAIRKGSPEIMMLFAEPFNTAQKWITYLEENFDPSSSGTLSVDEVLDLDEQWHSYRFQALYVACWIYHPLEKGSFMIELTPRQTENAERSAGKLTWRKSSHLSGTSRSARGGRDFKFIRGYGELLVMLQDNWLFLKMEGHAASHPAHLTSWIVKSMTGAGQTANAHLNRLSADQRWGILQRGAENYSKEYKALLKVLGFSGRTVTFGQVLTKLGELFPMVHMPQGNGTTALRTYLNRIYTMASANLVVRQSTLYQPLLRARKDLEGIVTDLERDRRDNMSDDVNSLGMNRIFREVRVTPARIDSEINRFVKNVQLPAVSNTGEAIRTE